MALLAVVLEDPKFVAIVVVGVFSPLAMEAPLPLTSRDAERRRRDSRKSKSNRRPVRERLRRWAERGPISRKIGTNPLQPAR